MRIILYPIGGLANRMRAIDSAYNMAIDKDSILDVFWFKDKGLNCCYSSLFNPRSFVHDSNGRILKFIFYLNRKLRFCRILNSYLEKSRLLKIFTEEDYNSLTEYATNKKNRHRVIIIKSFSAFYPCKELNQKIFTPRPEIEELIKSETDHYNNSTVGVHIRRGDNIDSITNSPLELFEEKMAKELEGSPDTNFYIASDDYGIKEYFENSYKWKERIIIPKGEISRNTTDGIIQAVVELFALSRTRKIIGSYWSSYSEMASLLGNIELDVVKRSTSELLNEFPKIT